MTCPSESFNPRSPCGERPSHMPHSAVASYSFQPTLPLRGATRHRKEAGEPWLVSTHAPLAGSDRDGRTGTSVVEQFQPTLPLRGATVKQTLDLTERQFQPTLPLRGATLARSPSSTSTTSFNPRSPCGERRVLVLEAPAQLPVSTHAPLAGSDRPWPPTASRGRCFNPRSPCGERRATP